MRAARSAYVAGLAPGERERLEAALIASLDGEIGSGNVAGYAAVGAEIDLRSFPRALVLPRVASGALTFHRCAAEDLSLSAFGIPEPSAAQEAVDPDVLLVPLLAVDHAGNRLGQGAGYYDRTLAALRARKQVIAIGVGWDMQLVAALPTDSWDEPLDAVATPSGFVTLPPR